MTEQYIPEAIKRLQLIYAFKGHATSILDCIEIRNDTELKVIDDNEKGHTRYVDSNIYDDKCLQAHNPNKNEIILLPIDNKFISNHCGGITDCAIFNTTLFCFAEFKANAQGNSQKAIEDTYTTAIQQLKETLKIFIEKLQTIGQDFIKCTEIICHIIVSNQFPRSRATEQTYQLSFAKETGSELSFESEITFE